LNGHKFILKTIHPISFSLTASPKIQPAWPFSKGNKNTSLQIIQAERNAQIIPEKFFRPPARQKANIWFGEQAVGRKSIFSVGPFHKFIQRKWTLGHISIDQISNSTFVDGWHLVQFIANWHASVILHHTFTEVCDFLDRELT
jgi:hypothetical protein